MKKPQLCKFAGFINTVDRMLLHATCLPVLHMPCKRPASVQSQLISRLQGQNGCSLHIIAGTDLHDKPKPWLFVGLGNPGKKYEGTRHNVGFEMIDSIAQAEGISLNAIQSKTLLGKGYIGDTQVLLAKPQTYMNLSGESVGPLATYYRIPRHRIFLMFDEMELPCGVMRLQPRGGHGRHNGMHSVVNHFQGRRDFPRLYIGIGNPPGTMDPKAYMLQQFSEREREQMNIALQQGLDAVRLLISEGFGESINRFNQKQKFKYHKV